MNTETQPAVAGPLDGGVRPPTDWENMSIPDLAMWFDNSAAWLLRGEHFDGPHIGSGAYLAAATRLASSAN